MIIVHKTNDGWMYSIDDLEEADQYFSHIGLKFTRHTDATDLWLIGFVTGSNPVYLQAVKETTDVDNTRRIDDY